MPNRPINRNRALEKQLQARQKKINEAVAAVRERDDLLADAYKLGYTHALLAEVLSGAGEPVKRSLVQKALERHGKHV